MDHLCQFALKSINSKYSAHNLVTDERTNGWTDGWTNGRTGGGINQYVCWRYFAFVYVYDVECVLSAIAKILVHLVVEGERRGGRPGRRRAGERRRDGRGRVGTGGKWECRKISHTAATISLSLALSQTPTYTTRPRISYWAAGP